MNTKGTNSFIVTLSLPESDSGYVYSEAEHKEYIEDRLDLWADDGYTVISAQPLLEKLAIAFEALEFCSKYEGCYDNTLEALAKIGGIK